MNLFDRIPLCHHKSRMSIVQTTSQPIVRCEECGHIPLVRVHDFIRDLDGFDSCQAAQEYETITNKSDAPVSFYMVDVDGILPQRIVGQSLHRIRAAVLLLKLLNSPFTQGECPLPRTILDECLKDFAGFLKATQHLYQGLGQEMIVHVFQNLVSVADTEQASLQKMDFYFDTLVPYVLACEPWTPLPPDDDSEPNLAKQLVYQFQRSNRIRRTFAKYSLYFDLFLMMAGTYVCCADMTVSVNWIADFAARLCCGQYFWKNYPHLAMVNELQKIVQNEVSYKKNTDLYYVLRAFKQGESMECMSENYEKYLRLTALVREKYSGPLPDTVMHHLFPAVVMDSVGEYVGFMFGMLFVCAQTCMKDGSVQKGTFAKARKMCEMGKRICAAYQDFTQDKPLIWTADTLDMFLATYPNLSGEIQGLIKMMMPDQE